MGVKLQLQVRAKAELRPMIYYMDGAFAITFKHSSTLTRLLTSSYSPNILFIHSSENDSSSPSPRSTDKLI